MRKRALNAAAEQGSRAVREARQLAGVLERRPVCQGAPPEHVPGSLYYYATLPRRSPTGQGEDFAALSGPTGGECIAPAAACQVSCGGRTRLDDLYQWSGGESSTGVVQGANFMSRFSSFILGLAVGASVLFAAMNYHVVRARDGFHVVNKQPPRMGETYVDIRDFGMSDWAGRPQLTTALVGANEQRLLGESATGAIQDGINQVDQLLPSWPESSAPQ